MSTTWNWVVQRTWQDSDQVCRHYIYSRDLRSIEIRFEFESAVPIRFESDGPIRKFSNRPCLPIARSSQTTQTINGA